MNKIKNIKLLLFIIKSINEKLRENIIVQKPST